MVLTVIVGLILVGGFALAQKIGSGFSKSSAEEDNNQPPSKSTRPSGQDAQTKPQTVHAGGKKKATMMNKRSGPVKDTFQHPWLVSTLKGHSGRVLDLDLSENGKWLASCDDDRSVILWTVKEFRDKEHKTIRCNVNFDHATKIKWSPDSKAFIVQKATENRAEVYKLGKKEDGSVGNIQPCVTFPAQHETDVIGLGFSPTGKFVMTCSDKTSLLIWSIHGDVLASLDTYHMTTYCAKVSPCGKFVASSGFTPDVKVWEVKFKRTGEFEKVTRAFELTGHTSGVFSFDFSADSSRMATVSKDGTWKIFKTNVEFERGQDPSQVASGKFSQADEKTLIALSANGQVVAIARETSVYFFSAITTEEMGEIHNIHTNAITSILFDREDRWFLTAGDKHIRVFKNVPGLTLQKRELEKKVASASTSGLKDRLMSQIQDIDNQLT